MDTAVVGFQHQHLVVLETTLKLGCAGHNAEARRPVVGRQRGRDGGRVERRGGARAPPAGRALKRRAFARAQPGRRTARLRRRRPRHPRKPSGGVWTPSSLFSCRFFAQSEVTPTPAKFRLTAWARAGMERCHRADRVLLRRFAPTSVFAVVCSASFFSQFNKQQCYFQITFLSFKKRTDHRTEGSDTRTDATQPAKAPRCRALPRGIRLRVPSARENGGGCRPLRTKPRLQLQGPLGARACPRPTPPRPPV